jgi:hypothetical protein
MPPYVLSEADQRFLIDGALRVLDDVLAQAPSGGDAAPMPPVP